MDVKYLKYILAIARRRNMTRAAEELYVSQSSLSQYLSRLEQELGTPLFVRNKGELSLTPAGELYVDAAEKVIKIQKDLYHKIDFLSQRGLIRVGVTSNFALRMLSEIIPRFRELYPGVVIEISETGLPALKQLLIKEEIDIGICAEASTISFGDSAEILREEEVFFAISRIHPYAQACPDGNLTMEKLIHVFANDNFVFSKKGSSLRILCSQYFEACDFIPSAFCETNSISATRNMVAQNAGVAFIAESCSIDREHIAYYPLSPALRRYNLVVHRKNWIRGEPENVFMDFIRNYFKDNTEQPYIAENYLSNSLF